MADLALDVAERMRTRLARSSVVSPSRWAEQYRVMEGDFAGPWTFNYFPWLKGMHDSKNEMNVGQKAAQLGYSETMLNIAFYYLDVMKRNVLYLLPNQRPDAADFTNRAINPAIELSDHIKKMFTGGSNSVGLKQVGNANWYIRGSNARSGLKSVPASVLIFDEFDEMDKENIKLAEERSSGQKFRLNWKVSTPTIPGKGINHMFQRSTQDKFFFQCPCCSRHIELRFPDNLVVVGDDPDNEEVFKSHLICSECKGILPHESKKDWLKTGKWVSTNPGQIIRGFYVNQLYSPALPPYKIAQMYLEASRDPTAEQEFYNSKMGLPHAVEGAQITADIIEQCIKGYPMVEAARPGSVITMGVDVNKGFIVEIDQWDLSEANPIDINAKARCKVLWAGQIDSPDMSPIAQMMVNYNVNFCVVDAMPETHMVAQFANEFFGRVRICRYNHYATARSVFAGAKDIGVSVNRTAWLDQSLGRFRNKSILLPSNLPRDYMRHIMALTRTPTRDNNDNIVYKYLHPDQSRDDYAHARNYAEIALQFATGHVVYKSIKEKV